MEIDVMVFWTTRREVLRVFGLLRSRRVWRRLRAELGADEAFARRAMASIARGCRRWSAPSDMARVPVRDCRDIKCLMTAVEDVMPHAGRTLETLGHITDAASVAHYGAEATDVETYRRTRKGWAMTRERGSDFADEGEE